MNLLPVTGTYAQPAARAVSSAADAGAAAEEDAVTWSVRPADESGADGRSWVEHELDPGESIVEHLEVVNFSTNDVTFGLDAADGYFTKTGRFNMLPSDQGSSAAGLWIDIDESTTVPAGESALLAFSVTVPENATPGDHAAGVAATVRSVSTSAEGSGVGVESRVGFRVITRVTGSLHPTLETSTVTASFSPSWNPFAPGSIQVSAQLENTGNVQLDVSTSARAGGRSVQPIAAGAAALPNEMLPGDRRSVTVDIPQVWPLGLTTVEVAVVPEVSGIASASEGAGVRPNQTVRNVMVWTIPWSQLALLALLVTSFVCARRIIRRRKQRMSRLLFQAREDGRRSVMRADHASELDATTTKKLIVGKHG